MIDSRRPSRTRGVPAACPQERWLAKFILLPRRKIAECFARRFQIHGFLLDRQVAATRMRDRGPGRHWREARRLVSVLCARGAHAVKDIRRLLLTIGREENRVAAPAPEKPE